MGLAGPKKRTKIAHDPNNNNWARSTNSFGHKILASQGWKPGDTLGARDANHATHYTAGSNSHIRVLLKDDNLGLGAARGGNNAETFGLSLYSGLLGRLNGKTDVQVEKEQGAQRDVELAVYQGRKYGHINFISAGLLVGDKIELKSTVMPGSKFSAKSTAPTAASAPAASDSASKKRKRPGPEDATNEASSASDSSDSSDDEVAETPRKSKKDKGSKKKKPSKSLAKDSGSDSTDESKSKDKRRKKEKKEKKRKSETTSSEDEARAEKKARKSERRAKKEEKRRRKEEKRASKSASATPSTAPGTPAEPAQQAVPALIGRQAVRQRYIAQKRMAHLNPQALKEIFMVKA